MADLIAIAYDDTTTAEQAMADVANLQEDLIIQADAVAAIVRDADGTFHTVLQLSHGYRGNFESVVRERGHPGLDVKGALFSPDDDVRIQNYCHLSTGALRAFRAADKSRRHDLASPSSNSVPAKASARSRPAQTFSSFSGTSRATGEPFLSRTKVTFW
jgi:hypothetical protein